LVPLSALTQYFTIFGKVHGIELAPLLKMEALERAMRLQSIRYFEVHLAGVETGRTLADHGESAATIFRLINEFRAPKAVIRVEVPKPRGRHQEAGSLMNVVNAIRGLLPGGAHPEEVRKIVVIGREPEVEEAVIDLLYDRLVERIAVTLSEYERLTDERRQHALITAWNMHREYIQRISTMERG